MTKKETEMNIDFFAFLLAVVVCCLGLYFVNYHWPMIGKDEAGNKLINSIAYTEYDDNFEYSLEKFYIASIKKNNGFDTTMKKSYIINLRATRKLDSEPLDDLPEGSPFWPHLSVLYDPNVLYKSSKTLGEMNIEPDKTTKGVYNIHIELLEK